MGLSLTLGDFVTRSLLCHIKPVEMCDLYK